MGLYRALMSSSELKLEGPATSVAGSVGESACDVAAAAKSGGGPLLTSLKAMSESALLQGCSAKGSGLQQPLRSLQPRHTGAAAESDNVQGQDTSLRGSFHARGTTLLGHCGTLAGHGEVDLVCDGSSAGAEGDFTQLPIAMTAMGSAKSDQDPADGHAAASSSAPSANPLPSLHLQSHGAAAALGTEDEQQWRSGFVPVEPLYIGFDTVSQMDEVRCPFPTS